MGRRALFAALALAAATSGCARVLPRAERREPVEVTSIAASFPSGDRGELRLTLDVENPEAIAGAAIRVSWEVWLDGRWFAAGTQGMQQPISAGQRKVIDFSFPVVFRRLEVRPDPTSVDIGVRGGVDLTFGGGVSYRLPFEATRRIVAQGAPVLTTPGDEE